MQNFDLDDMLRHGLDSEPNGQQYEFKEAYWLQAEALLVAYDRRRKRKRALLWGGGIAALLLVGGLALCLTHTAGTTDVHPTETPDLKPLPMANNVPHTSTQGPITLLSENNSYDSYNSGTPRATNGPHDASTTGTASDHLGAAPDRPVKTTQNNHPKRLSTASVDRLLPVLTNPDLAVMPSDTTATEAALEHRTVFYKPTSSSTPQPENTPDALASLHLLPSRLVHPEMEAVAQPILHTFPPNNTGLVKKHEDVRKMHLAVLANASTPSGLFYQEKMGLGLGIGVNYRLSRRFSVQTDLLWRNWRGNINTQEVSLVPDTAFNNNPDQSGTIALDGLYSSASNTIYDFGSVNEQKVSSTRAVQQLELPMALRAHWRTFALEAGAAVSYRFLSKVKTELYKSSTFDPDLTLAAQQQTYKAYEGQHRVQTTLMGGVHWQPLRRWEIGVRVQWAPWSNSTYGYTKSDTAVMLPAAQVSVSSKNWVTAEIRSALLF